jgi:hypothetical protein
MRAKRNHLRLSLNPLNEVLNGLRHNELRQPILVCARLLEPSTHLSIYRYIIYLNIRGWVDGLSQLSESL